MKQKTPRIFETIISFYNSSGYTYVNITIPYTYVNITILTINLYKPTQQCYTLTMSARTIKIVTQLDYSNKFTIIAFEFNCIFLYLLSVQFPTIWLVLVYLYITFEKV